MFTLVGFSKYQETGGVLTYVSALADQHVRVEGNNIVVPAGMNNLLGALAVGPTLKQARVEAPSLRRTLLLDLPDLNTAGEPIYPLPYFDAFYDPIPLDEFEPIRALAADTASGSEYSTILLWLGDGPQGPVSGEIYTVRAESTTTLTPFQWTNGALTFTQTLPAGRYQVVGMKAISTNLLAARLVFVGGTWRPGVPGADSEGDVIPKVFRRGGLGIYGEFSHDQPPTVDFLAGGPDSTQIVWLDLIKVA